MEELAGNSDHLTLETLEEGDALVIRPKGELDLASSPQLEAALVQADSGSYRKIVLDLSELAFIDSSGLRVLVDAQRRFAETDRLRVTRPQGHVAEMLRLTALDQTLPFA